MGRENPLTITVLRSGARAECHSKQTVTPMEVRRVKQVWWLLELASKYFQVSSPEYSRMALLYPSEFSVAMRLDWLTETEVLHFASAQKL